jgi:hypothetical protein
VDLDLQVDNFIIININGVLYMNKKYVIIIVISLSLLISLLFLYIIPYGNREGFTKNKWSDKTLHDFIKFENTYNASFIYDTDVIQEQATDEDVAYLIENNSWNWSQETEELYKEAILTSSSISIDPEIAVIEAKKIYSENAIKLMLAYNSKEGDFLLSGINIGHTKGLPKNINNIIKCSVDGSGLEKIVNLSYGGNSQNITSIKNEDVEEKVPGFKFINGSPCNPCLGLNGDYSCPFSLNTGDGGNPSKIWSVLWNI